MAVLDGFNLARLERRTDWTPNVFSLRLTGAPLTFKAGQFTKLGLLDDEGNMISRAYSLVNAPLNTSDMLEFLIVAHPEGKLTPKLQQLQTGDGVYVGKEAYGDLTFDIIPKQTQNLWLLSTGTGIGPFLSLLDDMNFRPNCDEIVLVHAVRHEKELVYRYLIDQLVQQYEGRLRYLPVVSRDPDTTHLSGRIPQLLQSGVLLRSADVSLAPEQSFVMLCGNPEMIKDTQQTLVEMGLNKYRRATGGNIIFERYW